jgi:hypothetical protein
MALQTQTLAWVESTLIEWLGNQLFCLSIEFLNNVFRNMQAVKDFKS